MNTPQNSTTRQTHLSSVAALRAAYGPGFQQMGPTESVLRTITGQVKR